MRNRLILAAALAMAAPLSAQVVHTRPSGSAGSAGSAAGTVAGPVAGIAAPQTFIIVTGNDRFVQPVNANTTVIFANIPAFVLTDGRVFANFGRGIEQVVRPCGGIVNSTSNLFESGAQPVVAQPVVVQPVAGAIQPLPFTPNVPNEPTISQQMLVQALATGPVLVNAGSCWAANRVGQVFVTHP